MAANDPRVRRLQRRHRRYRQWFLLACVGCASALVAGVVGAYQWQYRGRIYPGVAVAQQVAGAMTIPELTAALTTRRDTLLAHGLWLDIGGELVNLPLEVSSSDPDLARVPVEYDLSSAIDAAYRVGRQGSLWSQFVEPLQLRWLGRAVEVPYQMDELTVTGLLHAVLDRRQTPPVPAQLSVTPDGTVTVVAEQDGAVFDYPAALTEIRRRMSQLDASPVSLRLVTVPASIRAAETGLAVVAAQTLLATSTPTLVTGDRRWEISRDTLLAWLEFQREEAPDGAVRLGFRVDLVQQFLAEVAKQVDVAAQDAKFRLENGRVVEFQASRDGLAVDIAATFHGLRQEYLTLQRTEIPLVVVTAPAKVATGDLNDLGIRELLGVGRSNFKGSPKNRRHNIQAGVDSLNGILIAPEEEFSLLQALGAVDGEHGYLRELVIKGDRTTPEFGGGLCQIGTTTFRAALQSGLPITKRQNHSFRVRYYDPPGMDATIYDPAPDFRFLNDTGYTILFLAAIEEDELVFSFYGTKDGRVAEVPTKANILTTTPSGPVRYIETDELKPGEKRLVEKPAPGGTTVFTYKVTYPDGRTNEQVFKSLYRPWPETWLIGKTATPTDETIAAP